MLIAFSTCLTWSGDGHGARLRGGVRDVLRNVLTEDRGVERTGHAQGASERPPPFREIEAPGIQVQ